MTRPRPARSKVLSRPAAVRSVRTARSRGECVVFTGGCFDLLHVGHVRSLEEARSHGDRLVVGVNADATVRRIKGPGRPVFPLRQRAELLGALECVDWVVSFREPTPRALILALEPDVYAKGGDWPLATLLEKDVPPGLELRVERVREIPGVRTSSVVERVRRGPGA